MFLVSKNKSLCPKKLEDITDGRKKQIMMMVSL